MSSSSNELQQLLDLMFDQQWDDDQAERLRHLLAENPELMDQYIEQARLHSMLQWHCARPPTPSADGEFAASPAPKPAPTRRRSSRLPVIASILATTAVVLLVVLGLNNFWFVDDSAPSMGWVSDVTGVIWDDGQEPYSVGTSFGAGKIRTTEGRLVLQFKSGATLECDGLSVVNILSGMHVQVLQGQASVRVADSAKGFLVETPDVEVIDLGTEFGVVVREGRETAVLVFDGEVEFRRKADSKGERQRLAKGEAVRIDRGGNVRRVVQVNRHAKTELWSIGRSDSEDSVIRSVQDNSRDPQDRKYYEIVPGGFGEDALAYVDRRHQWNGLTEEGLPTFLRGGDYVKTFHRDTARSELEIRLTVVGPAMLCVLYDDRCPVPSWLSEKFTNTDIDVGMDNEGKKLRLGVGPGHSVDHVVSVWQRIVDEPGEIMLGPVGEIRRGEQAMYGIVAVSRVHMKRSSLRKAPQGQGGSRMKDWRSQAHAKWECKYHVVIVPKYRSKKVFGRVRKDLGKMLKELCRQKGVELVEGKAATDHVHMLLSVPPKYSIAMMIGFLKGKSAIRVHRELLKTQGTLFGRAFWSRGYCVSTVGLDEAMIKQYIQDQEKHERDQERGLFS